ncbi:MAG: sigma-70 region 4 domain-containing protein [Myxococcota bacterium]
MRSSLPPSRPCSERQQSALWPSVVEGHSYEEIAAALGSSVQSIKNSVHRARAGLADRMQNAAPAAAAAEKKR